MKLAMEIASLGSRRRIAVLLSTLVGLFAAVASVDRITLLPPGLSPRAVAIAAAHTSVVVDSPTSVITDAREDTYSFQGLQNRAILLGNVIASTPVLEYIAQRVHVPPDVLAVSAPATSQQPLPRVIVGHPRQVTDIIRYGDQYRLSIEANPTAPVLDIYSEAPSKRAALDLANAAVDGLRSYMAVLAAINRVPASDQIRLTQLGRADGGIANPGASWQLAIIAFLVGFLACSGVIVLIDRVRRARAAGATSARSPYAQEMPQG